MPRANQARTVEQLESALDDFVGGLQEFHPYLSLLEVDEAVQVLERLLTAAEGASERDHCPNCGETLDDCACDTDIEEDEDD
jgi:hypothetical protein